MDSNFLVQAARVSEKAASISAEIADRRESIEKEITELKAKVSQIFLYFYHLNLDSKYSIYHVFK